jgi:hypothetical protein
MFLLGVALGIPIGVAALLALLYWIAEDEERDDDLDLFMEELLTARTDDGAAERAQPASTDEPHATAHHRAEGAVAAVLHPRAGAIPAASGRAAACR